MDADGSWSHRVSQDVHHGEGAAHEAEAEARHCDKEEELLTTLLLSRVETLRSLE